MLIPTFLSLIVQQESRRKTSTLIDDIFLQTIMILTIALTLSLYRLSETAIIISQKNGSSLVRNANVDRIARYVKRIQNIDWIFLDTNQHL